MITLWSLIYAFVIYAELTCAETRDFHFNVTYAMRNVDGLKERQVISINNKWPAPMVRINRGDRVVLTVTNNIYDPVSIHFHGIFQTGSNNMDGAAMITQCPIGMGDSFVYNFTVDQVGTYWYHSHSRGQLADGLRGVILVDDPEPPFQYDEDVPLSVSDWYQSTSEELMASKRFARGSEPVVDSCLLNETLNTVWDVKANTTYYVRIANTGMSAPQYLYLEDHRMTIVEIDGVYVDHAEVDSLYITAGQRYGVLLKTKEVADKNFRFVQILQKMMSTITAVNWLRYNPDIDLQSDRPLLDKKQLHYINDLDLRPVEKVPVYDKVDKQIRLQFAMENAHYSFNHHPFAAPQIPTLYTIMSSPNKTAVNSESVYANSSNPYVIQKDEVVEIIVDSTHDMMKHPFHLHGHNFQVLYHGRNYKEMQVPQYPMIRDTMNLFGYSQIVLRFKADNPGVWFFHCHVDWHLIQGLAITLIEDPSNIKLDISEDHYNTCKKRAISISGMGDGEAWAIAEPQSVNGVADRMSAKAIIGSSILVAALVFVIGFTIYKRSKISSTYAELEQNDKEIELDDI